MRHYGPDWLRIGAFPLLVVCHIGMTFGPWHGVVTTGHACHALIAPMAAVTPWRMGLLFAVSGSAGAMLFARAGSPLGILPGVPPPAKGGRAAAIC